MRKDDRWPRWGPTVHNVPHRLLVWAAVFVAWGLLAHGVVGPLLGWVGHVTMDRAAGYHLRTGPEERHPSGPCGPARGFGGPRAPGRNAARPAG